MDILSFIIGRETGKVDKRVKYVTFMNGETELIKYPVIVGDNCKDVVTENIIEAPTKEPTESTVYTFGGWSLTDGGESDENALTNVTEDRTVYLVYDEGARMYTVNFYDGETLLETQQVAYGETPSYTGQLAKDDYFIAGWIPEITTVTGNAEYTASWKEIVRYLSFSSDNPFTLGIIDSTKHWDGTLEYSTDGGSWNEWDGTNNISSDNGKLYMRGTGNTKITGIDANISSSGTPKGYWVLSGGNISCVGNIEYLLDYQTVKNGVHPTMSEYCYKYMFQGCTSLTTAPELPATSLMGGCYWNMFQNCTSLTTAPELPATTLKDNCYHGMFQGCTSLTTAPELPATKIGGSVYNGMFQGCTSLTTAPELPATTVGGYSYQSMFKGCTSLTTAPELPATSLQAGSYCNMFQDCTSLTTAPKLPATYLYTSCYANMFKGCTSLIINSTSSEETPYEYRIPTNGTVTNSTGLNNMFTGTGGDFTGTPEINTTYYTQNAPV